MDNFKNNILKKYYNFIIFSQKFFEEDNNIFTKNISNVIYYINFYIIYFKNYTYNCCKKLLDNTNNYSDTFSEDGEDDEVNIDNDEEKVDNNVNNNDTSNNILVDLESDNIFINKQNQDFYNNVNKYFDQNNLYRKLYSSHLIAASIKRHYDRREYLKIKIATKILQKHYKVNRLNKSKYYNDSISKSENLSETKIIDDENNSYISYLTNSLNYFKW